MRVVYDFGLQGSSSHRYAESRPGRRESVIVISLKESREQRPSAKADDAYAVTLSDEAKNRDLQVRAHENAHLEALGGVAASGALYDTAIGPGGERVAVGGKIAVDMAEVEGDPAATLRKARTIIAAANAPGDPSAADMRTAARAYEMAQRATREMRAERESPGGHS